MLTIERKELSVPYRKGITVSERSLFLNYVWPHLYDILEKAKL